MASTESKSIPDTPQILDRTMARLMRMQFVRSLPALALCLVVCVALALFPSAAARAEAGPVAVGENFGTTTDAKGMHHYVSFRINPPRMGSWRVEGPAPSFSPFGGTNPDPWPQEHPYYVLAGFHWPDNVDPYLYLKPSDFKLYSK
jgi:hypothetical protein